MFRRATSIFASFLVLSLGGCAFESDVVSGLECSEGETRDDGATCRNGYWVGGSDLDAGGDATVTDDAETSDDAEAEMGCTPESDDVFCDRLGVECGVGEGADNCGDNRQVMCGSCPTGEACQTDQTCSCVPEDAATFCDRLGKDCGMVTDEDNCGTEQTYDCGACEGAEECGEQQANVCGCPCNIDGTCFPDGAENPEDPCEVCDPTESTTEWTLEIGRSCDDDDLCTINDVCGADGMCEGAPKDCSAEDGECREGMCDPSTGSCFGMAETGTSCSSDGLSCTDDVCDAGICEHDLTGGCIIDNTCYAAGTTNPMNGCEACLPGTSTSDWSPDNGGSCSDGLSCTADTCMNGMCQSSLSAGNCLIDGACYSDGTDNPTDSCLTCDASADSGAWTLKTSCCAIDGTNYASGVSNPSEPCEVCDAGTNQNDWTVDGDCCSIDSAFYQDGDLNPSNDCQECDTANSTSSWTDLGSNQQCCTMESGTWSCDGAGTCVRNGTGATMMCSP